MRRYIVMMLALALIFSASAICAETTGAEEYLVYAGDITDVPDLGIFAKLSASVPDNQGRVTVTLSEPVDRLWANWMGKGEVPEELFLNSELSATFSTNGHPYQVGATPPGNENLYVEETSKRYIIEFGALDSQVNWRTLQAELAAEGNNVMVVEPRWVLYRVSDDVAIGEFSHNLNCTDVEVPDGYRLEKVEGFAVAWRYGSNGSDGGPNLAYITVQKGYIVIYGRNGTIQSVSKYTPDAKVFGIELEPGNSASYKNGDKGSIRSYNVRKHIKEYTNVPELPPIYSFAKLTATKSGDGKYITVKVDKPVDRAWANWMGKDEEAEELHFDNTMTATVSTEGHKYQIGASWVGEFKEGENGQRQEIIWGAYPSYIKWATEQAKEKSNGAYGYVKVILPHWEVLEISTGKVIKEYDDKHDCNSIFVPDGYKLVKKEGYTVAYNTRGVASTGSPNLAYITEQDGFTVYYNRAGKIVLITKTIENSNFFEAEFGTATIQYQPSDFGEWIVSSITEVYPDNRSITAVFSRYGNGNLEDYYVSDF